jgi:hypothetical protein
MISVLPAAVLCNELKMENQQREIDMESLKRETEELEVAIR